MSGRSEVSDQPERAAPGESRSSGRLEFWGLILLAILFVGSYLRTLEYGFVWDDVAVVVENQLLDAPLWEGLTVSNHAHMGVRYAENLRPQYDSFRPLLFASYRLDSALFDRQPGPMHAHNVGLGLLCLLASYWFLREWGVGPVLRLCGAGVIALHPSSIEVLAYISGRGDLQAATLMLCVCASLLRGLVTSTGSPADSADSKRTWPWFALAALCYLLSLGAKEAYLFVPLALAVKAAQRQSLRRYGAVLAVFALIAAAWWTVRSRIAPATGGPGGLLALSSLGPTFLQYVRILRGALRLQHRASQCARFLAPDRSGSRLLCAALFLTLRTFTGGWPTCSRPCCGSPSV